MRLDKFLKVSRLIKRRTVANEACDNARINGKPAKASYAVKPGDKIAIAFGSRTLNVEVLQVADNVQRRRGRHVPGDPGVMLSYCILLARLCRANFTPSFIFRKHNNCCLLRNAPA